MTKSEYAQLVEGLTGEDILKNFPDVSPIHEPNSRPTSESSAEDSKLFEGHDEEQIKLMEEVCIVLDNDDKPVGSASKKTCHIMTNIDKGLLHRAFSVFLFNDKNELLLQQRADEKITFAQMWTNTCCSHPLAIPTELGFDLTESIAGVKNAAQRKLLQELGIPASQIPLDAFTFLTRIHYVAPSSTTWGEHEMDYILFIKTNVTLDVNPNECKDVAYVSASQLKEMFKDDSLVFTPWFKLICDSYLFKWWDSIDEIGKFRDDSINRML